MKLKPQTSLTNKIIDKFFNRDDPNLRLQVLSSFTLIVFCITFLIALMSASHIFIMICLACSLHTHIMEWLTWRSQDEE